MDSFSHLHLRRLRWRSIFVILMLLPTLAVAGKPRDLVIWGMSYGPDTKGLEAMNREFERLHPDVRVQALDLGAGAMSSQKLLTAIVGDAAPDVVSRDRFTIADWASRGAFMPLDSLIERDAQSDPLCPNRNDYYPAAWREASYGGHVYGIPQDADSRALYWNRTLFRERAAPLRAAGLDPNRPPRTWSETLAYSRVLTDFHPNGTLARAGFMPNFGNSWLYLYAFENDAEFLSPDGRTCTLDSPASERALEFVVKGYDLLGGYQNANAFEASFLNGPHGPFVSGQVAMMITVDTALNDISQFAPNLDFDVAPPPVPDSRLAEESDPRVTWSGGSALVIPRGARNPEDAWTYIKYASSVQGRLVFARAQAAWERHLGRTYIPTLWGNRKIDEAILREFTPTNSRFASGLKEHLDLLSVAKTRPSTFVSQALWDAQVRAMDEACYHKASPHDALAVGQAEVQKDLDDHFGEEQLPVVDGSYIAYGLTGLFTLGAVLLWVLYRRLRLPRLARREARHAYLFLSPWMLGFVALTFGPMLVSLFWSFTHYSAMGPPRWVGLQNYVDMATVDRASMSKAFFNAGYLALFGVPLALITGLVLALLLNTAARGMRLYRTLFYSPSVVSGIATAVIWGWLLMPDPRKGLVNGLWYATISQWLGIDPPGWMIAEPWAKHTLIIMGMWGAGGGMLLWLAGLKEIPISLYEASGIDGASPWQQFWKVTVPQLSPVIFFMTVIGFIGSLQEFDRVFVLKGNDGPIGPADSLLTPVYHLFDVAFGQFKIGYASAIAWVVFIIIALATLVQFKLAPRWVRYEADV